MVGTLREKLKNMREWGRNDRIFYCVCLRSGRSSTWLYFRKLFASIISREKGAQGIEKFIILILDCQIDFDAFPSIRFRSC